MNTLNLARKWRPERFDEMVGQEIVVRMLKNSLYRGHFFPVYLFSGQRGCGKTTAARIFAAAINCARLSFFRQAPTTESMPCLNCVSCLAMKRGDHPDFVEVDAASHTGVDNVRQLIESAAFLPVIGSKKVYLIDEVHMLSKAACNALLKILEEPPAETLFILATTDPQKMIETIRSRCFHLFFMPINGKKLGDYLEQVCQKEEIGYERSGVDLIVKESEGCVRDALNLLEQARFSSSVVDASVVSAILGHVSDDALIELIQVLHKKDQHWLLTCFSTMILSTSSVEYVWRRLAELLRALIWLKHGVTPTHLSVPSELQGLVGHVSFEFVHGLIAHVYSHQERYAKLSPHYVWLEVALLDWCVNFKNSVTNQSNNQVPGVSNPLITQPLMTIEDEAADFLQQQNETFGESSIQPKSDQPLWQRCMDQIEALEDRLITSILRQAKTVCFDQKTNVLLINFLKEKLFFKDLLIQHASAWQPTVRALYGASVSIECRFDEQSVNQALVENSNGDKKKELVSTPVSPKIEPVRKKEADYKNDQKRGEVKQSYKSNRVIGGSEYKKEQGGILVDTSDRSQWPIASMILDYFPGTITALKEDQHGIS